MSGDVSHLALVCGVTVAVNGVSAATTAGREPIVTVLAGGVAFVALAIVGGLVGRYDIVTAVAYVFLVAAIVQRGLPLIRTTTILAKGK